MKAAAVLTAAAIILIACGGQPEEIADASPLTVIPDTPSLFSMAVLNPAAVISALDGYASGVPLLGENAVSGWILSALDCADMSEVDGRLGIRTDGGLAVFMESMMPQSIGAALTVPDPDTFWANIGLTPQPDEPLEGYEVSSIPVDFGSIYLCHARGLLLAAGSRAALQTMLERIDGQPSTGLADVPDGSFYMSASVETFGPMVASQLAMMQPQLMSEMTTAGEMDPEMMQNMMGLYFDAIGLMLTDVSTWSCVVSFGPEYVSGSSTVEFVPGSTLDRYVLPVDPEDMTGLIPAGDIMVARLSLDPSTSAAAMNAVFDAMGLADVPQEMVEFWAKSTSNTAWSMFYDPEVPLRAAGVYTMPEGSALEDVKNVYETQFAMMSDFMEMPGLELSPVEYAEYRGRNWVTFGMNMDMAALQPDTAEEISVYAEDVSWTVWMTEQDGALYMEMAPEPATVADMLDGTYQGDYASEMAEMGSFSDSSEMAVLLNMPGYLNMALAMSGLDVPPVDFDPVWMELELDITQGGMSSDFRFSGSEMTAFIGKAIQAFSMMAQ